MPSHLFAAVIRPTKLDWLGDVQFNKLPKKTGFDFAQPTLVERSRNQTLQLSQPTLVERSRWHSLSVKRKPNPHLSGMLFPRKSLIVRKRGFGGPIGLARSFSLIL